MIASMKNEINIKELVEEGEGYLVEFKESAKNLEKEICAFVNASGGIIYIGIGDDGKKHPTKLNNKLKSQLIDAVHNCDPTPEVDIQEESGLIVLKVSEGTNKPVRAPKGFYLRIGATSQKLTRDEILSFAVKETKILFDSQLLVDQTANTLLNTRQVELFRSKAMLDLELDNMQLLRNLGLVKYQNNKAYLTYAGVLSFSKNPQLFFPQSTVTLLNMLDSSTIIEQKILKGTLFEQVEHAFFFLKTNLRSTPVVKGLQRENKSEFPDSVLRELILNSIIHRDYFDRTSDVVIRIFPDYVEFSNAGTVSNKLPLSSLFGRSYRRNPMIADIFFHANYIERAGTGLLRIKQALKDNYLAPLELFEEGPFFIVTLPREKYVSKN